MYRSIICCTFLFMYTVHTVHVHVYNVLCDVHVLCRPTILPTVCTSLHTPCTSTSLHTCTCNVLQVEKQFILTTSLLPANFSLQNDIQVRSMCSVHAYMYISLITLIHYMYDCIYCMRLLIGMGAVVKMWVTLGIMFFFQVYMYVNFQAYTVTVIYTCIQVQVSVVSLCNVWYTYNTVYTYNNNFLWISFGSIWSSSWTTSPPQSHLKTLGTIKNKHPHNVLVNDCTHKAWWWMAVF